MKKLSFVALLMAIITLSACGNSSKIDDLISKKTAVTATISTSEDVPSSDETASSEDISSEEPSSEDIQTVEADGQAYDLDFTTLGSNMIYAEVYAMMYDPYAYVGKTIRVRGNFTTAVNEDLGVRYYFVLIQDALACCQQGVEFIWDDNTHVFPDEYPEDGTEIELCGTLYAYVEGDYTYSYIEVHEITLV